jgi:hypothetical protein
MPTRPVLVDLDPPHKGDRPSFFIIALLALAIGGIGGYAVGFDAAGSTIDASAGRGSDRDRTDYLIDRLNRHIAVCDSPWGASGHREYCLGIGEWQDAD